MSGNLFCTQNIFELHSGLRQFQSHQSGLVLETGH